MGRARAWPRPTWPCPPARSFIPIGARITSEDFAATLAELGIRRSVGRTGSYDNSLSESTNGAIKVELVNREEYPTRAHAMKEVARCSRPGCTSAVPLRTRAPPPGGMSHPRHQGVHSPRPLSLH
jgi:transposase InsO family protein